MKLFFITLTIMILFILLCAVGYIFAKKKLSGSCGGLGRIFGDSCLFCEKKDECETKKDEQKPLEVTEEGVKLRHPFDL